jgi:hypothetical protein
VVATKTTAACRLVLPIKERFMVIYENVGRVVSDRCFPCVFPIYDEICTSGRERKSPLRFVFNITHGRKRNVKLAINKYHTKTLLVFACFSSTVENGTSNYSASTTSIVRIAFRPLCAVGSINHRDRFVSPVYSRRHGTRNERFYDWRNQP